MKLLLDRVEPMKITAVEEQQFQRSKVCHICEKCFTPSEVKVRDHSHLTGKYRGSAHNHCNLLHRESRTIPIVFHNLSHYDSHFILETLANDDILKGELSVIASNSEKYVSFTKTVNDSSEYRTSIRLKFIDSCRFMQSLLDHLASLIPAEGKKILHSEHFGPNKTIPNPKQMHLLERKGVLCYDYIDSWEKLNDTKLPPKEAFYSKLNDDHISDQQYDHAQQVWNTFTTKTIGEYTDLYLKTDILLLADVFENFRKTCLDVYKLDAVHYITTPALSFDAMLHYTKVEIELLTDVDQHLFVENGKNITNIATNSW